MYLERVDQEGRVEFKSNHKCVTNIPQKTACHVAAIDHIPPCYEVKLVQVSLPVFSSDDKLS